MLKKRFCSGGIVFYAAASLYLSGKYGGMKILFHYYKSLHSFNIPFSLLVSLFGLIGPDKLGNVLTYFFISLLTGGFLLSVFFYGLAFENRYYFYYNKGYSKTRLIIWAYLLNLLPLLIYVLIKKFGV